MTTGGPECSTACVTASACPTLAALPHLDPGGRAALIAVSAVPCTRSGAINARTGDGVRALRLEETIVMSPRVARHTRSDAWRRPVPCGCRRPVRAPRCRTNRLDETGPTRRGDLLQQREIRTSLVEKPELLISARVPPVAVPADNPQLHASLHVAAQACHEHAAAVTMRGRGQGRFRPWSPAPSALAGREPQTPCSWAQGTLGA